MGSHRKRRPPEREAPYRRMPVPVAVAGEGGHAPHERKRRRRGGREKSVLEDAAARGVNTAYCVVEEYVRRGYEAARAYERVVNQETTMGHNDRHPGCDRDGWNPMEAMMAPWMVMTRAWLDSMSAFMPGAGGMGSAWAGRGGGSCGCGSPSCGSLTEEWEGCSCGCGASSWETCGGRRRSRKRDHPRHCVALHVISPHYTEGVVELSHGADEYRIKVGLLTYRDDSGKVHQLKAKVVAHASGRTIIRVNAPKGTEPGVYRGDVYCGDWRCGQVCLTVFDDDADDDRDFLEDFDGDIAGSDDDDGGDGELPGGGE